MPNDDQTSPLTTVPHSSSCSLFLLVLVLSAFRPFQNVPKSNVFVWLRDFYVTLMAKFGLCFHGVLSKPRQVSDMRQYAQKLRCDYLGKYVVWNMAQLLVPKGG